MPYIKATCPKCGGNLSLDVDMEKGYCTHCGSLINFTEAIRSVNINEPIKMSGFFDLGILLEAIEKDLYNGTNFCPEFKQRLTKALELDPDNQFLYDMITSEMWNVEIVDHTIIQYHGKAKKIIIPDGVVAIGKMAFGRHPIDEITLPKSLKQISEGAFIYESKLTIKAYKDTYAARYALASPARLSLLDVADIPKSNIKIIEETLVELVTYKNSTLDNIKTHLDNAYAINWGLALTILAIPVFIIFLFYRGYVIFVGATILSVIFILVDLFYLIVKTSYNQVRFEIALKQQSTLFLSMCDLRLSPLGIKNFEYRRDIFDNLTCDLELEVQRLKNARDDILNMDIHTLYKKPRIKYSFFDYLSGKKA